MIVSQLWRYPVKSLRGESVQRASFEAGGIAFDRRYVVLDPNPMRQGKPLTGRLDKRLLAYSSFVDGEGVRVRTPSGRECGVEEQAWLDELAREIGSPVVLERSDGPIHDDADVLVVSASSIAALAGEYGAHVDRLRFRPNIVLDGIDLKPFAENAWEGKTFAVGEALFEAVHTCGRCVMTTIDPETLDMDPKFLRLVVEKHNAQFGMYFRIARAGTLSVGDAWTAMTEVEANS